MMKATILLSSWKVHRQDLIFEILKMVLAPQPFLNEKYQSVLCGACYGHAMLHHAGKSFSHMIAPVTYMWNPHKVQTVNDFDKDSTGSTRQLWLWIHCAAFDEGFTALRSTCQQNGGTVGCFSREGQLGKVKVMGPKSLQVLQRILHPVLMPPSISNDFMSKQFSTVDAPLTSHLQKHAILGQLESLPLCAILSLTVHDPRDLPVKSDVVVKDDSFEHDMLLTEGLDEVIPSSLSKPEVDDNFLPGREDLWARYVAPSPPLEESILCRERNQRRLSYFYLNSATHRTQNAERKNYSRYCPIMLLKDSSEMRSFMGFSIILPLSWVKAFWMQLIVNGARAIGLQEKHWIASKNSIPSFPYDFPDCKAYSDYWTIESTSFDQRAELIPLAVRPAKIPMPSPWGCIKLSVEQGAIALEDGNTDLQMDGSETGANGVLRCFFNDSPFEGLVARTSEDLSDFLNGIDGNHHLLFPYGSVKRRNYLVLIRDGVLTWVPKGPKQFSGGRLCFLRVLLRAYREGVFDEGAVICAPHWSDILMLQSRTSNNGKSQIPQSSVVSYFTQCHSGGWELHLPKNFATYQSQRWPIGFVTSGFVRGSSKPVALAMCEVTLLAFLRQQQWSDMQEKGKPEIYVLVRNLRSTAYRLALATVILEEQEKDVESM